MYKKKSSISTLLFLIFTFIIVAGCSQDVTLATRSMTDNLPVVTIPGARLPSELGLSVGFAIDSRILDIEADSKFLTFARVRQLRLDILDASDVDAVEDGAQDSFDFISGLSVSIRAAFGEQTLEEVIAFLPDGDPQFGSAARSLDLSVVNSDLLDFLQAPGGYQLVLNISGNIPPDAVVLGGSVRYRVGVGL